MAINLKNLDRSGISGWGTVIVRNLKTEMARIREMEFDELQVADLSELKARIRAFEEIRERATELGLTLSGYVSRKLSSEDIENMAVEAADKAARRQS